MRSAEQQVVLQILTKGALTPHRVESDEQEALQQSLGWNEGSAHLGVHPVELRGRRRQSLVGQGLDDASGWSGGTRASRSTKASIVTWGSCYPRIGEHLRVVVLLFYLETASNRFHQGGFQQPASGSSSTSFLSPACCFSVH